MMKSVIIVSTTDLYYGNSAAVARMNNYARSLALVGVNVYLLSTKALTNNTAWIEVEPRVFTLPLVRGNQGKGYNLYYIIVLIRRIKELLKTIKGEIVLLNYPGTSSLLLDAIMLLSLRKYPLFCEVNEVRRYASGSNNNSIRNRLFNYLLEQSYKWYDGIVFISRHIKEYYSSRIHRSVIVPILSDCSKSFALSEGVNTLDLAFVGTVSFPKENLEELLEGFCLFSQNHHEARLKMYGIMLKDDKVRFEDFVEKHKMKDKIVYLGKIPHSAVEEVLSTAGALLLSRSNNKQNYYGFSTKLSEYAVSGAPIIMTDTGVVADYFQDKVNCLMCDGYNSEAFKKKFEELAQMSVAEKKQIAENAYVVAKNNFDYRLYSAVLKSFFFN